MSTSAEKLIERIRQADVQALADFIAMHRPQLLAFINKQLGAALRRKVEADDLLQETAAEAVRVLPETDLAQRDPFGWLCQIAQRRTIDAHRHYFEAQKRDAGRELSLDRPAADTSGGNLVNLLVVTMTTASQAMSRNERELRLRDALERLPQEQQRALRLRYMEGLPSKEIAEQLGKTDGAVRVMLTRSLARLQELLGG